jgi:hypothetical protein
LFALFHDSLFDPALLMTTFEDTNAVQDATGNDATDAGTAAAAATAADSVHNNDVNRRTVRAM